MPENPETVWNAVLEEVRVDVPDSKFHIWIDPLSISEVAGSSMRIAAPDHIRTWVRDRYLPHLTAAARRAYHPAATLEIVEPGEAADVSAGDPGGPPHRALFKSDLNPKFTFEQFVIGGGNRFAHAAALACAEMPGLAYNPLFVHGRPGLGKTHLLHAIGNYVERFGSGLTVRFATVEEFTSEFVAALRDRRVDEFKQGFRGVDVLLLDDVQFLARKARTEEELFHTFNFLHGMGKQVVMTCDRHPDELDGLEDRLGERFASGLVVGLDAPDLPVRRAILDKRARLDAVDVDGELIETIAQRVSTSVRALEAALIQVIAYASLRDEPPTPELARKLLQRLAPTPSQTPDIAAILDASASHFGVERASLVARDRRPSVARARKIAMYLARELTDHSLPDIGRDFGGRDHSTVLHAVRSVSDDLGTDPDMALVVESLKRSLRGPK